MVAVSTDQAAAQLKRRVELRQTRVYGEDFKEARLIAAMDRKGVAELLRVTVRTVKNWEQGSHVSPTPPIVCCAFTVATTCPARRGPAGALRGTRYGRQSGAGSGHSSLRGGVSRWLWRGHGVSSMSVAIPRRSHSTWLRLMTSSCRS